MKREKNEDIGFFVKKISNHIEREMYNQYKNYSLKDITLMNIMIINFLATVDKDKEVFQKDIEEEFYINKATASKMLSLMEEKSLIERCPLENDGRLKKIVVLEKGESLKIVGKEIINNLENKLKKDITQEELDIFKKVCRLLIKNMEYFADIYSIIILLLYNER